MDTGVALPTYGWIRIVGTVAGGVLYSARLPASIIGGLTDQTAAVT